MDNSGSLIKKKKDFQIRFKQANRQKPPIYKLPARFELKSKRPRKTRQTQPMILNLRLVTLSPESISDSCVLRFRTVGKLQL